MASIILKRKSFAGMGMASAIAQRAAAAGKGMGNVNRSVNSAIGKYGKSRTAFNDAFSNWSKNNKGGVRDFIKTDQGQKLWNANRGQAGNVNKALDKATQKAGLGTTQQVNTSIIHDNGIKKSVGMGQGIQNTWNSGAMGKAKVLGTGAALVGTGALAGSMMSGGGQSEQRGYSEKTTFRFKRTNR